jgi:hypothetical protein
VYTIADRDWVRDELIAKAEADPEVVAAALIGSTVVGGDRWSDLDLTFGVAAGVPVEPVIDRWTRDMVTEYDAAVLFDLAVPPTVYRVFLLPGVLQVDLSFTADAASKRSPRFRQVFGELVEQPSPSPPALEHFFGLGVLSVTHARTCIERGRHLQAEYWIHDARFQALTLACARLGLDTSYARGFGQLPAEVTDPLDGTLVRELTDAELRRAWAVVAAGLLGEGNRAVPELASRVEAILAEWQR